MDGGITTVFTIARAVLHKYVVRSSSHQAKSLVTRDSRFTHISTATKVSPFSIDCKEQNDRESIRGQDGIDKRGWEGEEEAEEKTRNGKIA